MPHIIDNILSKEIFNLELMFNFYSCSAQLKNIKLDFYKSLLEMKK